MQCEGVVGADGWVSLYPRLEKGAKALIECVWHHVENDDARQSQRYDQRRHQAYEGQLGRPWREHVRCIEGLQLWFNCSIGRPFGPEIGWDAELCLRCCEQASWLEELVNV